jgi:hypothetical protein
VRGAKPAQIIPTAPVLVCELYAGVREGAFT